MEMWLVTKWTKRLSFRSFGLLLIHYMEKSSVGLRRSKLMMKRTDVELEIE